MPGNDYAEHLRKTLDAARTRVLGLSQTSDSLRHQNVVTLGHAEQTQTVMETRWNRDQDAMEKAARLYQLAMHGGADVKNADGLAASAKESAARAANSLAGAAAGIKSLADAFDTLAADVAGVEAVARNDDAGTPLANAAVTAKKLTNDADHTVETLKAAALTASIETARSLAASTADLVVAVGTELEALIDRSGTLLASATQRSSDSLKLHVSAWEAASAADATYHVAKTDSEALADARTGINTIINGNLSVTPGTTIAASNTPSDSSTAAARVTLIAPRTPSGPALVASYQQSDADLRKSTEACFFLAVPTDDAPAFGIDRARATLYAQEDQDESEQPAKGGMRCVRAIYGKSFKDAVSKGAMLTGYDPSQVAAPGKESYRAVISYDVDGRELGSDSENRSYVVFVLRVPKRGLVAATRASDLSLGYGPIEFQPTITNLDQYVVSASSPPDDGTVLKVTLKGPSGSPALQNEYRPLLLLEDVYQAVKGDALFLTSLLQSRSNVRLPDQTSGEFSHAYQPGDTDIYGDIIPNAAVAGVSVYYRVLVLVVPPAKSNQAIALITCDKPVAVSLKSPPAPATVPASTPAAQVVSSVPAPASGKDPTGAQS